MSFVVPRASPDRSSRGCLPRRMLLLASSRCPKHSGFEVRNQNRLSLTFCVGFRWCTDLAQTIWESYLARNAPRLFVHPSADPLEKFFFVVSLFSVNQVTVSARAARWQAGTSCSGFGMNRPSLPLSAPDSAVEPINGEAAATKGARAAAPVAPEAQVVETTCK